MTETSPLLRGASSATGRLLKGAIWAVGKARPADKPMHPRGEVRLATLTRTGAGSGGSGAEPTGAAFLDEPGTDEGVVVRFSRSAGTPEPWPDVNGLAVRVPTPDGAHADILLAGAFRGRVGRYLLAFSTRPRGGFFSTLLPYRSPTGPVHLGATAVGGTRGGPAEEWELLWARPGEREWHRFGTLGLDAEPGRDLDISFDAVLAAPAGLEQYEWHRRLREPAYAVARRLRGA